MGSILNRDELGFENSISGAHGFARDLVFVHGITGRFRKGDLLIGKKGIDSGL